jgi:hypothetical protein
VGKEGIDRTVLGRVKIDLSDFSGRKRVAVCGFSAKRLRSSGGIDENDESCGSR